MIKALKSLIGLAGRADATTEELAPSLPQAEAELAAAQEAQEKTDAAYRANLLKSDDTALRKLVEARTDAAVRVDRAVALVEALRERLAEAEAREEQAGRLAVYEAARVQADEARRFLAETYPTLAKELVEVLRAVAEAELAVSRTNAALPDGVEPIPPVEASVRFIPAVPEKVLSERKVELWVREGELVPSNFLQEKVHQTVPGRGVIPCGTTPLTDCTQVELRTLTEQRFLPALSHRWAHDLAERIVLPGLRADEPDLWRPIERASAAKVLARLDEAEIAHEPRPVEPQTRLVPDPGATRVEAIETARDHLRRRAG